MLFLVLWSIGTDPSTLKSIKSLCLASVSLNEVHKMFDKLKLLQQASGVHHRLMTKGPGGIRQGHFIKGICYMHKEQKDASFSLLFVTINLIWDWETFFYKLALFFYRVFSGKM